MLDLSGLNREQLEAVLTTEGPLLVLAGAGSGKTRVITYRLARLVEQGVPPQQLLCVTFTNKAALEMKERGRALVGRSLRGATLSTFHALGARILRAHPEAVGLREGFTITDSAEQLGTLRRILRTLRIDDRRFDPKRIMTLISHAKNAGVDAARFREMDGELLHLPEAQQEDEDYQLAAIEVYERYESALLAQNVVDFDDLLLLPLRLLEREGAVRARLEARFRYLMVDEYQDTNGAQLDLVRVLAGSRRNLCVVGDDDQSIYGWRGADVRNILRFEEHFPGAKRIMLLTNYRSTGAILSVANAIISGNPDRYEKVLRTASHDGEPVRVSAVEDEDVEAEQVASRILDLVSSGVPPGEIAVLFRSNVQSRPFELALRASGVPYRMVGGLDLFDRKEVKDALAYLRVLHNPDEEQALRRIVNWPPRGIGDTTLRRVDAFARDRQVGLLEALARVDEVESVSHRAREAVLELVSLFRSHRRLLLRQKASTVAKKLLDAAGLERALLSSSDDAGTAERRIENVRGIVRQLERYEQRARMQAEKAALEARLGPRLDAQPGGPPGAGSMPSHDAGVDPGELGRFASRPGGSLPSGEVGVDPGELGRFASRPGGSLPSGEVGVDPGELGRFASRPGGSLPSGEAGVDPGELGRLASRPGGSLVSREAGVGPGVPGGRASSSEAGGAPASASGPVDLAGDSDLAPEPTEGSLEGFLADLALSGFEDARSRDPGREEVVLSTIHAAKGLEWTHVFLVGWEEELLPHRRTTDDPAELAEERRLAYVAVTRARRSLTITWAKRRTRYGQIVERVPSRFLEGLPEDAVLRLEGSVRPPRTEVEEKAIARDWMARIRADLEAKRSKPAGNE